jgi:hypothetical protein
LSEFTGNGNPAPFLARESGSGPILQGNYFVVPPGTGKPLMARPVDSSSMAHRNSPKWLARVRVTLGKLLKKLKRIPIFYGPK